MSSHLPKNRSLLPSCPPHRHGWESERGQPRRGPHRRWCWGVWHEGRQGGCALMSKTPALQNVASLPYMLTLGVMPCEGQVASDTQAFALPFTDRDHPHVKVNTAATRDPPPPSASPSAGRLLALTAQGLGPSVKGNHAGTSDARDTGSRG